MAHVTGFSHDVFISYSHLDDQAVGGEGWVTSFHKRLQIELDEELGEKAAVWRDGRIGSADDFTADLEKELRGSAVLIAIVHLSRVPQFAVVRLGAEGFRRRPAAHRRSVG